VVQHITEGGRGHRRQMARVADEATSGVSRRDGLSAIASAGIS
jgi:hypothetical protein